MRFLKNYPGRLEVREKRELSTLILETFNITSEDLVQALADAPEEEVRPEPTNLIHNPIALEQELQEMIDYDGFLARYAAFTTHSEAPLAYHVFSALITIGATVNRRLYFPMGYFKIYPAMGVILLGPSGLKKTTSSDIAVGLLTEIGLTKIYSEKLTPEALVGAMESHAQGLVYAPELSVLLGKQKYNEGMVPLLTRFMDCPDLWQSETISRGMAPLRDVAISFLGCSTPDWFVSNTPEDTFGGGFIARLLLVMQDDSPRIRPIPRLGESRLKDTLKAELVNMHTMQGEMTMSLEVATFYTDWYTEFKPKQKVPEHELLVTYYQRKPTHLIRLAMCIHIADCRNFTLCLKCIERALRLLDWTEQFLPPMLRDMFKTVNGVEHQYVLRVINSIGGSIEHSNLLRKVQHKMDAGKLKGIIASLKEADMIGEYQNALCHMYVTKRR